MSPRYVRKIKPTENNRQFVSIPTIPDPAQKFNKSNNLFLASHTQKFLLCNYNARLFTNLSIPSLLNPPIMNKKCLILAAGLTGLLAGSSASAAINIDTVSVGDAGNANDSFGFGGVSYNYHIGTHEVTNNEYAAFLNAKAGSSDPNGLYNTNMGSSSHGGINKSGGTYSVKSGFSNKPVNFVSFWDATRFSNWLTNGQGNGDTETGVYNLTSTGINNNTITRDSTAFNNGGVAIASENEWYKAAYYYGSGSYFNYPTQSNLAPTATIPNSTDANSANFDSSVGSVSDVGSYTLADSHYGTFDQGGNVQEWNDNIVTTSFRRMRGASWINSDVLNLSSSNSSKTDPIIGNSTMGFRVSSLAPIPEPSAYAAILGCLGLGLALIRRKGRSTV